MFEGLNIREGIRKEQRSFTVQVESKSEDEDRVLEGNEGRLEKRPSWKGSGVSTSTRKRRDRRKRIS